jgi:galactonate dehydratase
MKRRFFLKSLSATVVAAATGGLFALASLPKMKISRVRAYLPPNPNPLFNQSDMVVTIETDTGILGVGEGGSKDLLEQAAGRLIGRDPQHIEQLWQDMNRAFFYPAGRERTDAIGALDLRLGRCLLPASSMALTALLLVLGSRAEQAQTAGIVRPWERASYTSPPAAFWR